MNSMDDKELIYDQFFGEKTMNYVELKNRTAGKRKQTKNSFHPIIYVLQEIFSWTFQRMSIIIPKV